MNKKLKIALWATVVLLVFVVLYLARKQQEEATAQQPIIAISVVDENAFLTESELLKRLKTDHLVYSGQTMEQLNTHAIERYIRKMHEVESVAVYKIFGGIWCVDVKVRQPYARIFNRFGESFYIDSKGIKMNPSPNFTARVLVFSGNIVDRCDTLTVEQIEQDERLRNRKNCDEIYRLAKYIALDPFLKAQIAQVQRDKWGDFILIPQVGNHEIVFGAANSNKDVVAKLNKLKIFYQEGLPFEGWNKYNQINLKYKNQVVCKKRNFVPEIINQNQPVSH
jgi:cell division protein FtsQ